MHTKQQNSCDGLVSRSTTGNTKSRKRRRREVQQSDSEPEEDCQHSKRTKKRTAVQEREEKVLDSLDALKKKHGANYTQMQYRLWADC